MGNFSLFQLNLMQSYDIKSVVSNLSRQTCVSCDWSRFSPILSGVFRMHWCLYERVTHFFKPVFLATGRVFRPFCQVSFVCIGVFTRELRISLRKSHKCPCGSLTIKRPASPKGHFVILSFRHFLSLSLRVL